MIYDVIIVGAGAAGLFCGAHLQDKNKKILILEKSFKPGLKLVASGSGQCNFTHGGDIKDFVNYYGDNGKKVRGILFRFNNDMVVEYFEGLGVKTVTREDGKVFPASLKAEDIRSRLLGEIDRAGGKVICNMEVVKLEKVVEGIKVFAKNKDDKIESFICKNIVIATGGKSYPKTGSDGKMFEVLKAFGEFDIVDLRGALVPIYVENYEYESLSGIAVRDAVISKGKIKSQDDLLFTHKNLSGPLMLNFSRYLDNGDKFKIDYLPQGFKSSDSLKADGVNKSVINWLADETGLPKGFLEILIEKSDIDPQAKASTVAGKKIKQLENLIRGEEFTVSGKAGFDKAMVTAGGISLKEVSTRSLQSKKHPELYFIGEVLDVDGDTGGYNIQFAFSSGYAAAQHILQLP